MGSIMGGIINIAGGGTGSGATSGITSINGQIGPAITINSSDSTVSINSDSNTIDLSASGVVQKRSYNLIGVTSGLIEHGLMTDDIIAQVYDTTSEVIPVQIIPDEIKIENLNNVSVLFNSSFTGKIIIMG